MGRSNAADTSLLVSAAGLDMGCGTKNLSPDSICFHYVLSQECMVACQEAPDCESFVVNEVLAQCFLKKEQCPEFNFW
jgi:hypothetical protein